MATISLAEYASRCESRPELALWFDSGLRTSDGPLHIGDVELALVEETLEAFQRSSSIAVINPIPGNELVLSICLGYLRIKDPGFPQDGLWGSGKSLCLFPALSQGYVTDFDSIRRQGIGQMPKAIDRQPIDGTDEIDGSADLFTAKHGVDLTNNIDSAGAIFVDFRKKEWKTKRRRFTEMATYLNDTSTPTVFYFSKLRPEYEELIKGFRKVEITNTLLSSARPQSTGQTSTLSTYAQILSSGECTLSLEAVHYPEMKDVVADMANMKSDLKNVPGLRLEVGWLFNLLTELPVKPKYWNEAVDDNYHYQTIGTLISNLRSKSRNLSGMTADLVINYTQAASYLVKLLNAEHPVQEHIFEKLASGADGADETKYVVRNKFEREALLAAIAAEDATLPDAGSIIPISDLTPNPEGRTVFTRPLKEDAHVYEFPSARDVEFIQFEIWARHVTDRLESNFKGTNTTIHVRRYNEPSEPQATPQQRAGAGSQAPGQSNRDAVPAETQATTKSHSRGQTGKSSSGEVVNYEVPDYDDPDALLDDVLAAELTDDDSRTGDSRTNEGGSREDSDDGIQGESVTIRFEDGTEETHSVLSRVTLVSGDSIVRVPVKELEPGDTLLVVDEAQSDVYDLFIESAHDRDRVRGCKSTIDRWRSILQEGLEEGYSQQELIQAMQEKGSSISTESTISSWRSGRTLGPRSAEDVRIVLEVVDPDSVSLAEPTVRALKEIRGLHRQIGKEAKRSAEAEAIRDEDMTGDIVNKDMDVGENTMEKTVESITHED